jgi:protein involved in polysaccharide export with SLBB domain
MFHGARDLVSLFFHQTKGKSLLIGSSLFSILLLSLPSCSSDTAIKGKPVNQVATLEDRVKVTRMQTEQNLEALTRMSEVKENSVFETVRGIPEYRIGAGDVLEISSHTGDKVTSSTVPVDSRGRISYSFIDHLEVDGLTCSQLEQLLTTKLSAYVRNPRISVFVKEFNSKSATIVGEFSLLRNVSYGKGGSGRINLRGRTTLTDLIALGGGYTLNADIKSVKVVRKGKSYLVNLFDILEKGDEDQNVIIDEGDVVNIPELPTYGERVYVLGEVNNQGIYPLKEAQDLLAAIALSGNTTRQAKEENTLIVRAYEPGKPPLVMMADVRSLLRKADISQNVRLRDGDLVYVPRMLIADINDWIINMTPLLNLLLYPGQFEDYYAGNKVLLYNQSSNP